MTVSTSDIVAAYQQRTRKSAACAERARAVFPSGISHDSRYLSPYPICVERAEGSRKWDVDGNEYVDYAGGHGALLLGHNHPRVVEAVSEQLARGTHYGACHELEIRWGELVRELIASAESVRFTNSGTEATLLAMRLARAATGKPKIVRFEGHFHGWHDHAAFGVSSHFDGSPSPGVLPELAEQILLAPAGDIDALEQLLGKHDDVAGVIVEPTGASWGKVPLAPEFITALRSLTTDHDVNLIFDEVISGFRCSPGGAQATLGVTPDLTTLAKILAGGLPGGAVAGRSDLMDHLSFETEVTRTREKVPHYGTFNANPISAAAGIATLELIATTDACERANDYARRLRDRLNAELQSASVGWIVYGTYSGFHIFTNPDRRSLSAAEIESGTYDRHVLGAAPPAELITKLRLAMLLEGVDLFVWPGGITSAAHTLDDLELTVAAFRAALARLDSEGELR